ncbi:MAG: CoA-binding protein [Gammaproteobacteria bacterium]|nr:MAG: CoA-binding protein [Gammaproteobacteria bacterium]
MAHRLDPLLRPGSIAVLGATERAGAVGRQTLENLLEGKFPGRLYAINPGYQEVLGVACFPSLEAVPEPVEHVIFAIGDARVEAALDDVIEHGARAATIMSSLVLADDTTPLLRERIEAQLRQSDLLVCGANGMGFYNFTDGVWACGFDTRHHGNDGNVVLISHSGSGMAGITDCEERIRFSLAVSTGQELGVSMDDYIDFALDRPETRVIGLFMETVRKPDGMRRALQKANDRNVPVVALKVGRTELAARLAISHSGAMAGHDAAYDALFDRYGVQRVDDMDELATALIMFAQPHPVGDGGLVTIHDSGGERQLMIDLAHDMDVPLTQVSDATAATLTGLLDAGLPPVNPLDAWGAGGPGADKIMEDCLAAMMADEGAAIGAVIHDRAPHGRIYKKYLDYMVEGHDASGKPTFLVSNRQGSGADPQVVSATHDGFPVLDGIRSFLRGVKCLFDYRDFRARKTMTAQLLPPGLGDRWRSRLAAGETLDEADAATLMLDAGLPMNPNRIAEDERTALAAAAELGFPVVLKTAQPGILHKTDQDGVRLGIVNEAELVVAWRDMSKRLGPRVLLAPMLTDPGVEMMLGWIHDAQFGPLVMLGFGGVHIKIFRDIVCALPPFDAATARRLVDGLRLRELLDGQRGGTPVDIAAYCEAAARFSLLAASLGDVVAEADINPVIVGAQGCVAVDALVVGRCVTGEMVNDKRKTA